MEHCVFFSSLMREFKTQDGKFVKGSSGFLPSHKNVETVLDGTFLQSNEFTIGFSEWQRCKRASSRITFVPDIRPTRECKSACKSCEQCLNVPVIQRPPESEDNGSGSLRVEGKGAFSDIHREIN